MNYQVTRAETRAPPDRERVADLLARYPELSDADVLEILTFMRSARHLEIGLLTSNDRLRPKLDAFMDDHKRQFQVSWREGVAVAAGAIALLAILWLIWEAFA